MIKFLKAMGFLVIAVVSAGVAFFIWQSFHAPTFIKPISLEDATASEKKRDPGTYLIYQMGRVKDYGSQEWANDDVNETTLYAWKIGESEPHVISTILSESTRGGVFASIFGEDLLVHRYSKNGAAIVSLDGVVQEIPEIWGSMRSKNGRFELAYASVYDGEASQKSGTIVLWDREQDTQQTFRVDDKKLALDAGELQPTAITNDGSVIYLTAVFSGEGSIAPRLWKLFTQNGDVVEVVSLHALEADTKTPHAYFTTLDPDRALLYVSQMALVDDPTNEMGGMSPGAPTTLYKIDLAHDSATRVFQDDSFALEPIAISPDGETFAYGIEGSAVWIMPKGHEQRANADMVSQGALLDWFESGMVIRRQDDVIYLDSGTRRVQPLGRSIGYYRDPDYQTFEYIGSITINPL